MNIISLSYWLWLVPVAVFLLLAWSIYQEIRKADEQKRRKLKIQYLSMVFIGVAFLGLRFTILDNTFDKLSKSLAHYEQVKFWGNPSVIPGWQMQEGGDVIPPAWAPNTTQGKP